MKTFKETIREELYKQNKTWYWLADELGMSRSNIHNITKEPKFCTVQRIGKALKVQHLKIFID